MRTTESLNVLKLDVLNLTAHPVVLVDPKTHREIARIPLSGSVARVVYREREPLHMLAIEGHRVPVREAENPVEVLGLPASTDVPIFVAQYVARAMRALRIQNRGGVLTGDDLIFVRGVAVGYAGFSVWLDL